VAMDGVGKVGVATVGSRDDRKGRHPFVAKIGHPAWDLRTRDFMDKIAWEGGLERAIEYGLASSDADDPMLGELWQAIANQYARGGIDGRSLEELADELRAVAAATQGGFE
jgi:hypothetical protein